jgi:hypothetical protein
MRGLGGSYGLSALALASVARLEVLKPVPAHQAGSGEGRRSLKGTRGYHVPRPSRVCRRLPGNAPREAIVEAHRNKMAFKRDQRRAA